MPKHRAPAPPAPGDQIPDTQAPPPPLPLNSRHSSSSHSLRSNHSSTSDMGHNSFDRRQDPKSLPYFFSNFTSQDEVCHFLIHHSKKKPGFFLLRPSFSNRSSFSVSVVVPDKTVRHTNIKTDVFEGSKRYFLVPEVKFPSVQHLVSYYGENEVKNLQKVNNVRFLYPLKSRRESRTESFEDSGSSTSGNSHYQSTSDVAMSLENPPALPSRPRDLPRLSSQNSLGLSPSPSTASIGSPGEVFQNGSFHGSSMSIESGRSGARDNRVGGQNGSISSIDLRPPAMLPIVHLTKDGNPYYSSPRNVDEDITDRLKEVLRQSEVCDCGIPRDKADLPLGWTVHRSKDPSSFGKIFFQNNKGVTSWRLPQEVESKLNYDQHQNLKELRNERIVPVPSKRRDIISETKF